MNSNATQAALLAAFVLLGGCTAPPTREAAEPDSDFVVTFAWSSCPFFVARAEVDPAVLARLLPSGFALGTYATNASQDERGRGHLYAHAVRCPQEQGESAYYAWWSTVVVPPPYLLEGPDVAYRIRLDFAWPGEAARRAFESAHLSVTTARAEWSAAPGMPWTATLDFEDGPLVTLNASSFDAAPPTRQRVVEFALMGDGRLATWEATLSTPPGKVGAAQMKIERGDPWLQAAVGGGTHDATVWTGVIDSEDAEARVPLGGW